MLVGADTTVATVPPAAAGMGIDVAVPIAPDALMRATSARRAGTPRGCAVPATGGFPPAKRPTARVAAEVPPAPSREMTMQEVTHSLQHLMAHAMQDTTWIGITQTVLEDHAKLIDENATKSRMLNQVGQAIKADINKAFATVEDNDIKIKSVIEDLSALTQESMASLDTSLRD